MARLDGLGQIAYRPANTALQPLPLAQRLARLSNSAKSASVLFPKTPLPKTSPALARGLWRPLASFARVHPVMGATVLLLGGTFILTLRPEQWQQTQKWLQDFFTLETLRLNYERLKAFTGVEQHHIKTEMEGLKASLSSSQTINGPQASSSSGGPPTTLDPQGDHQEYEQWCRDQGLTPVDFDQFIKRSDGVPSIRDLYLQIQDKQLSPGTRALYRRSPNHLGWGTIGRSTADGYVQFVADDVGKPVNYRPEYINPYTPEQECETIVDAVLDVVANDMEEHGAKAVVKWLQDRLEPFGRSRNHLVIVEVLKALVDHHPEFENLHQQASELLTPARTSRREGHREPTTRNYERALDASSHQDQPLLQLIVITEYMDFLRHDLRGNSWAQTRSRQLIEPAQNLLPQLFDKELEAEQAQFAPRIAPLPQRTPSSKTPAATHGSPSQVISFSEAIGKRRQKEDPEPSAPFEILDAVFNTTRAELNERMAAASNNNRHVWGDDVVDEALRNYQPVEPEDTPEALRAIYRRMGIKHSPPKPKGPVVVSLDKARNKDPDTSQED